MSVSVLLCCTVSPVRLDPVNSTACGKFVKESLDRLGDGVDDGWAETAEPDEPVESEFADVTPVPDAALALDVMPGADSPLVNETTRPSFVHSPFSSTHVRLRMNEGVDANNP